MYKTSTNNIELDQRVIRRLEQAISTIKAWAGENLVEVSMFGSYAIGKQHKFSSIDLLVIICESNERFIKRKADLERLLNEDDQMPLIDPLVYTEEEIMDLINKKESFIDSVLDEAIVVWHNFNDIDIHHLFNGNGKYIHSRYLNARPKLESVIDDYS
jgi:predicted nucleotidyltransferase